MAKALACLLRRDVHDHVVYKVQLAELKRLIEALGYGVVKDIVQSRPSPHTAYLFGKGKVMEMAEMVRKHHIDAVFVYNVLTSKQKLNLMRELGTAVADRYDLTLRIFDGNAVDGLSKLQIELARLNKLFPLYKLEASIALKTEHPSLRAMGEYAYHKKITGLRRRIAKIRASIRRLRDEKIDRIKKRRDLGFRIVCIGGYYNAGKTSLFNVLTASQKPVSDRPFTTLSSKYQRPHSGDNSILFVDTIGFVLGLNPELIESFELNLQDLKSSDVVLFLVDASDPIRVLSLKLESGLAFMNGLGIGKRDIIVVLNKVDLINGERSEEISSALGALLASYEWVWVSVKQRTNIPLLVETIMRKLEEPNVRETAAQK